MRAAALASLPHVEGVAIAQTHGDGAAVEHVPEDSALGDPAHLPLADLQIEAAAWARLKGLCARVTILGA
jgi:hypothetical protein